VAGRRKRSMTRGKIAADLAAALALRGECLADIAVLQNSPRWRDRSRRTRMLRPVTMAH
jgi:hypothetical protein